MDADARHSALLAAAEPFEALTEQAATAKPTNLNKLVADARSAATAVSGSLDPAQRTQLEVRLSAMESAQKSGDRTGVALAAVEGYRTLVQSAADTAPTPQAVSLLDYAGFRYQANLTTQTPRWADAAAAADFANTTWPGLSSRITDASLRDRIGRSIADMQQAVQTKNVALAKSASTTELDLVDKLEAFFVKK